MINEFIDHNKDVSFKDAVLAVSKKRPDLFTVEASPTFAIRSPKRLFLGRNRREILDIQGVNFENGL